MCNKYCIDFCRQICGKLEKPPYVCNSCGKLSNCTLEKKFYTAVTADKDYRTILMQSRTGIALSEDEIARLDGIISPLVMKRQSPHHIYVNNKDSIMVSERTMYRLIDDCLIAARNIDLPRKVRFSARKSAVTVKVDKACRIGRDYECFTAFLTDNPDTPITELDTVEGKKGGKVLLTVHFVKAEFMLAFLRGHNDSQSVIDIFERLYLELRPDRFADIFGLCLADNGSEFSNPKAIEFDKQGNRRARLYYCDPSSPFQKGSAEKNHQFIRCFFPKGKDISAYSQSDISLMMDHINSYGRKTLSDKTPHDMFAFLYGNEVLSLLGCNKIPPNEVTLNRSVFRKGADDEI
jgi:IS30 family transposase